MAPVKLLLLLQLLAPAAAVQSRLGKTRQAAARFQRVLGQRASHLKRAIWDELGFLPEQQLTQDAVEAASRALAREAGYLAAEDREAAEALRGYGSSGAFVPLLALPMEMPQPSMRLVRPALQEPAARMLESEETFVQQDANGQLVRTTRRCRESRCVTEKEVVSPGTERWRGVAAAAEPIVADGPVEFVRSADDDEDEELAAQALEDPYENEGEEDEVSEVEEDGVPSEIDDETRELEKAQAMEDIVAPAIKTASRQMAREMKRLMENAGIKSLEEILNEAANKTLAAAVPGNVTLASSNGTAKVEGNMTEVAEKLGSAFTDWLKAVAPNVTNSLFGSPTESESVSTVAKWENGHWVRHIKHCKQGQCTEETEEDKEEDE